MTLILKLRLLSIDMWYHNNNNNNNSHSTAFDEVLSAPGWTTRCKMWFHNFLLLFFEYFYQEAAEVDTAVHRDRSLTAVESEKVKRNRRCIFTLLQSIHTIFFLHYFEVFPRKKRSTYKWIQKTKTEQMHKNKKQKQWQIHWFGQRFYGVRKPSAVKVPVADSNTEAVSLG